MEAEAEAAKAKSMEAEAEAEAEAAKNLPFYCFHCIFCAIHHSGDGRGGGVS